MESKMEDPLNKLIIQMLLQGAVGDKPSRPQDDYINENYVKGFGMAPPSPTEWADKYKQPFRQLTPPMEWPFGKTTQQFDKYYPPKEYEGGGGKAIGKIKPGDMYYQGSGLTLEEQTEHSRWFNSPVDDIMKNKMSPGTQQKVDEWQKKMQEENMKTRANTGS